MITAKDREASFRRDLQELLDRYGADMYVTDDHEPYGMQAGIVEISIPAVYDGLSTVSEGAFFTIT